MSSIKFSATSTATAASSITVALGGTPAIGDLVVVFLGTYNEIITHQPGWASEFTATPNPWFVGNILRATDTSTLSSWYHTWNASDSGTSVTFNFVPAPSLGIGDKDVSLTNAVAIAVVFDGSLLSAQLEHNVQGVDGAQVNTLKATPLKLAANMALHAVFCSGSTVTITDSDPAAVLVQHVGNGNGPVPLSLTVYRASNTSAGYAPTFTKALSAQFLMEAAISVSENQPQLYNPPYIEEAPMGMNALMARYRMNRYFTVLNNAGTFNAQRYQSTDQIAAATQVFTNNQPITATDRTNILNSGVGGDFQAVT